MKILKINSFQSFSPIFRGIETIWGNIEKSSNFQQLFHFKHIFYKDSKLDYFILGLTNAPENAKMSGSNIFVTLNVAHCSSHRFQLVYAFENTFIEEVDTMLIKIYYLYKKNTKRLRELCELKNMKSLSQSHPKQM